MGPLNVLTCSAVNSSCCSRVKGQEQDDADLNPGLFQCEQSSSSGFSDHSGPSSSLIVFLVYRLPPLNTGCWAHRCADGVIDAESEGAPAVTSACLKEKVFSEEQKKKKTHKK